MYLCGHPGTGKTSTLNQILQTLRNESLLGESDEFQLYMYNAMTFTDVRSFALSLLQDVTEKKTGQ
jgi:Cdc6-like AAA superfamily ATPase